MAPVVENAFYMINSTPFIKHDMHCNLNVKEGKAARRPESIFLQHPIVLFQTHIFPMSLHDISRRFPPTFVKFLQKGVKKQKPVQGWFVYQDGEKKTPYHFPLLYLIKNGHFEYCNYFSHISCYSYFPEKSRDFVCLMCSRSGSNL